MQQDKNSEIFNKICDIVINPEFNEVQINFFQKNCSVFTNDDENKLIYQ